MRHILWAGLLALVIAAGAGWYFFGQDSAEPDVAATAEATTSAEPAATGTTATETVEATPAAETAVAGAPDPATGYYADERMMGNPAAKAVLIEYASLSCPHCAAFHAGILPQLKRDYIDSGKLLYVYRHFPLNEPALRAALLADCLPEDERFFGLLDLLFSRQMDWVRGDQWMAQLFQMVQLAGFDEAKFKACAADEARTDEIVARMEYGTATFDVSSTPTLLLNGEKFQPESYEALGKAIDALQ